MTTAPPTRVVVADDSGLMRRVLTHALTDAGFDVETLHGLHHGEAVRALEGEEFARRHEFNRARLADDAREPLRAASAGKHPE